MTNKEEFKKAFKNEVWFKKDIQECLDAVKYQYDHMERAYEEALERVRTFRKDEEIQKANARADYAYSHSLYTMSDKEMEAEKVFRAEHWEKCAEPLHSKAKGNTYLYRLTGTGLGTVIEIGCPLCGEWRDVSDVDSW